MKDEELIEEIREWLKNYGFVDNEAEFKELLDELLEVE